MSHQGSKQSRVGRQSRGWLRPEIRTTPGLLPGPVALLLILLSVLYPPPAAAGDSAMADKLFAAARKLMKQKKYTEACPKLEASFKLDEQLGTVLNLGDCYEQLGRLATAWAKFGEAVEWASRDQDDREAYASRRRSALEPRLPKLRVNVVNPVATLAVFRGDTAVPAATYGMELPVDPGPYDIQVRRGEVVLTTEQIRATEGELSQVTLDLKAIDEAHPAGREPDPDGSAPQSADYDPTQRSIGLIVGGIGLGAVLAAVGLEIAALIKKGQADEEDACINGFCSPQGIDAAESAALFAEAGQWIGIIGLGALGVGATIFFTAPSPPDSDAEPPAPEAWLSPWIRPGGGGLLLGGRL